MLRKLLYFWVSVFLLLVLPCVFFLCFAIKLLSFLLFLGDLTKAMHGRALSSLVPG